MVSFATELVEIKTYVLESFEKQEKKDALKQIKINNGPMTTFIKFVLYRYIPTEEQYIERRNKGKSGSLSIIEGFNGKREGEFTTLYRNGGKKISYNVYMNIFGKMISQIKTKGFGIRNKYAISMFDIGSSMEDIFGAEHKAKMFIINTTRRLFDENDIM